MLPLIPAALIPWVTGSLKSYYLDNQAILQVFCKKEHMVELCHVVVTKLEVI